MYLPEGMLMEGVSNEKIRNIGYPLRKEFRRIPLSGLADNLDFQNPPNYWLYLEEVRELSP